MLSLEASHDAQLPKAKRAVTIPIVKLPQGTTALRIKPLGLNRAADFHIQGGIAITA